MCKYSLVYALAYCCGEEREPLFVISNDLVIGVAGGVGKFRGSNFNLFPRWALLTNLCSNFFFIHVLAPHIISIKKYINKIHEPGLGI